MVGGQNSSSVAQEFCRCCWLLRGVQRGQDQEVVAKLLSEGSVADGSARPRRPRRNRLLRNLQRQTRGFCWCQSRGFCCRRFRYGRPRLLKKTLNFGCRFRPLFAQSWLQAQEVRKE